MNEPRVIVGLVGLGLAVLAGGMVARGCSSPSKQTQIIGNSAYLNFNYQGQEPVNLLSLEENAQAALVDLQAKDQGATYGFIHPTLRLPVTYETTKESQRLVEDLTMKMYRRRVEGSGLQYIPDWFCEYDKNHDRIMQTQEIKTWEADILKSGRSRP